MNLMDILYLLGYQLAGASAQTQKWRRYINEDKFKWRWRQEWNKQAGAKLGQAQNERMNWQTLSIWKIAGSYQFGLLSIYLCNNGKKGPKKCVFHLFVRLHCVPTPYICSFYDIVHPHSNSWRWLQSEDNF